MIKQSHSCSHKLHLCTFSLLLGCSILIARLFFLQIIHGNKFTEQSKRNFTRYEETVSLRGNILDTHGRVLATNRPVTDLYWQGTGKKNLTHSQKEDLSELLHLLSITLSDEQGLIQTERSSKHLLLQKDISFEQLGQISERFPNHPNIKLDTHCKRFYPYNTLASHVLGYIGHIDRSYEGKTGIEKLFEETLKGKAGSIMRIINSTGTHLAEFEIEKTLQGQHITTTIDLDLQQLAEQVFPEELSGCLLVMDPYSGAIRACLSRPTFDPNLFTAPFDTATWNELQEKKPFINRISCAAYPIGSIFKLVTLSAGLETGMIEEHSAWDCRGYITFAGRKYHCVKLEGHGVVTTKLALAHSCNIPFFDMGKRIDIDTISDYARRFGLGNYTGSLLPESKGLIPSREWKKRVKKERWWMGETLSATIGQTFLLATPLQIARLSASIHTGFLVTPRIIEDTPIYKEPLNIHYETRKFLQKGMHAAVTKGTARWLDRLHDKGFIIYTKTSTAQTASLDKSKTGKEFLEHSWLTTNFTYKEHPALTLVIITEFTGRTGIPPRIAYNFLKGYKRIMDLVDQDKGLSQN